MKLYNVVKTFDVYAVAESPEEARAVVETFIRQEGLPASDEIAIEATDPRHVREAWHEQRPMVADDVSDADFDQLKGKTTMEIFKMLHVKEDTKTPKKEAKAK